MLTRDMVSSAPDAPGVYFFRDKSGRLLYIGKAKSLRKRVRQYTAAQTSLTPKVRRMVRRVERVEMRVLGSELEALITECRLIKEQQPHYNVALKRARKYPFLKIQRAERFPRVLLSSDIELDGSDYFGPFPGWGAAQETRELVHQLFPVRTCEMDIRPRDTYRPCFKYHVERCGAPCAALVADVEYDIMLERLCDFLLGEHKPIERELMDSRQDACGRLEFERARLIQNRLEALQRYSARNRYQVNAVRNNHLVVVCPSAQVGSAELFLVKGGAFRGQVTMSTEQAARTLTATLSDLFMSEDVAADLTAADVDAMNVMSQWLYANRDRQEVVRVDGLSERACADAADAVRHVLLSTTLAPRSAQAAAHVR
ncbi:GIY-YIG nuclease family protein [Candidatus Poribacteria bacterium]|jgi:DNA polymerase III subunit epsilon|nr:GIY-YIG nuclease family protein [Candidatus Poribacteria bacterium]MBT5712103.1 GIY-YIG nuclease family protein [Candidatus Poribacteria bacterium]MBT7098888.1 GIY-YIG nuclease family protein [Candidatus Poribacteria bacterium]MBT7804164.1 GIY-YIG nuclease family protein [Candidatus Poribacteria bacterium]